MNPENNSNDDRIDGEISTPCAECGTPIDTGPFLCEDCTDFDIEPPDEAEWVETVPKDELEALIIEWRQNEQRMADQGVYEWADGIKECADDLKELINDS